MPHTRLSLAIVVFISIAVLATLALYSPSTARAGGPTPDRQTITVEATGTVQSVADMARIQIGVHNRAPTAAEAVRENSRQMEAVIDALIATGIDKNDLSTSRYCVSPVYEHPNGQERMLLGFSVDNRVNALSRDIAHLGETIDSAVQAGANTVDSIALEASDRESLEDEAINLAVRRARDKAEVAAEAANQSIIGVQSMQVTHDVVGVARMVVEDATHLGVPIMPGQISVNATVQIVFEMSE